MGNSREEALGESGGEIQSILNNTYGFGQGVKPGQTDPIHNIWTYFSQVPDIKQLMASLQGNQMRDLGLAGRQAGATASAYGLNPLSAMHRSQSPIYGQYAQQFSQLPMQLAQMKLAANQGNFENLYRLLALKQGIAGQRSGGASDWLPGIIQGAGSIAAAAA